MSIPADPALPATIVRDPATGLADGGIRLPDVAVPTRTLTGERPVGALQFNPNCFLFGAVDPWNGDGDAWDGNPLFDPSPTPEPTLAALYGSHGRYVSRVVRQVTRLVGHGWLRPTDGWDLIVDAARFDGI
jgi:hypothetical protein